MRRGGNGASRRRVFLSSRDHAPGTCGGRQLRAAIPMKNKLADLNNHLFAQLERLSEEGLSAEKIEAEAKRADAIVAVSEQILRGADLNLKAVQIVANHGDRFLRMLPALGNGAEPAE
jgi:hypothetical protein